MGYPKPPSDPKPSPKPSSGGGGSSGGGSSGSSGSSGGARSTSQSQVSKNLVTLKTYVFGKGGSSLGVVATKAQRKVIVKLLTTAAKNGYNSSWVDNQLIRKTPKAWLASAVGKARIADAKDSLEAAFGFKLTAENKALLGIVRKYAKDPNMNAAALEDAIQNTKRFKGEFGEDYKAFIAANPDTAGKGLATNTSGFRSYKDYLTKALTQAGITDPTQIALETSMMFKGNVKDFAQRFGDYLNNREAYKQAAGAELTEAERQAAMYADTAEGAAVRTRLSRAGSVAQLTAQTGSAFRSVMGRDLTADERLEMLNDANSRTELALGRAGSVSQTLAEQAESYRLQTGVQVTQEQKDKLLYDEGAGDVYGALKSAFSLQKSYRQGSAGSFGFARGQGGVITQNI